MNHSIVFIHGLFQNPASWKHWETYFQQLGYTTYAPAYPYHEGSPTTLRQNVNPALAKLTFNDVVQHYVRFIEQLPSKPILIGHSVGGLLVQKLLELGHAEAVVSIDSAPPMGLLTFKWSFWKANFTTVNPLKGNSVFLPSVQWFQYAFCNTMTLEQTQKEYDQYVVPESRNIPRSTLGRGAKIDFRKPHKPLLIIAGEQDNIIPASLNRKNYLAYKDKQSVTDFKMFPGRTHYICGQENWQEVAQYIQQWLSKVAD